MKKWVFLNIISFILLFSIYPQGTEASNKSSCDATRTSVMSLIIENKDGRIFNASAFLTAKDKIAVTAWQAVKNATRITAKFPNGEEFKVLGVIDKDVRRNLALIEVKVFGRPLLPCNPQQPQENMKVYYWKKDFTLAETTLDKIKVSQGVKIYYLSSLLDLESTGGPLLNNKGEVIGVLGMIAGKNGKNISIAIPSSYVLALDDTLPLQTWNSTNTIPPSSSGKIGNDVVDKEIAESLIQLHDHFAILNWSCLQTYGMGYRNGVPKVVYKNMAELKSQFLRLVSLKPGDSLRTRILQEIKQGIKAYLKGTEFYINSVVIAQGSPRGWGAKSQDLYNRADVLISSFPKQSLTAELNRLKESSPVFKKVLPRSLQYSLGMIERPSGYTLGITNYVRNPFYLLIVDSSSVAKKIGLRAGDTIISLDGHKFTPDENIEDFKVMLKSYQGQKVKAVVKRNSKLQEIILKVPQKL